MLAEGVATEGTVMAADRPSHAGAQTEYICQPILVQRATRDGHLGCVSARLRRFFNPQAAGSAESDAPNLTTGAPTGF